MKGARAQTPTQYGDLINLLFFRLRNESKTETRSYDELERHDVSFEFHGNWSSDSVDEKEDAQTQR